MRKLALSIVLIWLGGLAAAFEIEDHARFGPEDAPVTLRILSTTDTAIFARRAARFLETAPGVAIDYTVASSAETMRAIEIERQPFDLVISSAMDLQTKLANDGFARRHVSGVTRDLPDWAKWNDLVFAFTQEPAAIVLSNAAFEGLPIPRSREDLIAALRRNPDRFRGRVGTYDVRNSGLGYLFATQEGRVSDTYWRLTEVMGGLDARLYCCSSQMIDDVARGELAVAYNVLGSYAFQRDDLSGISIILPSDLTTVMLRSVLIPRNAPEPEAAGAFVDHTLAQAFEPGGAFAIDRWLETGDSAALSRIRLGPGLLVYLDRLKMAAFRQEWTNAMLQR
ncbi:ABC transporter substrate-binding protein [Sulfitobacter sp. D35]|uniref:ABC transporter substrate-binding protein n=1 Tax=Sulfitobacter sp. D35 TaxID=3083252 RepID=UPI00296F8285|nr:ABC transporter substrate-binding protein [Sulfitobacter sp. D35]MDW4496674.1 ABC transporter substrate-binding protein [Sulfitobacter sp. D35]